jgi:hypothetical protein
MKACAPSPVDKHPSGPEVVIADLIFEGDLHLAISDQDQIAASLKERTYSGEPDGVASDVLERVRRGWQDRGYIKVEAHVEAHLARSRMLKYSVPSAVELKVGETHS